MNYTELAKMLINKYPTRLCLKVFNDLSLSDVQNLIANMNNVAYFERLKNELDRITTIRKKHHIEKLLNTKIRALTS
ncbi:MAG: hypothetical protein JW871_00080 [Endomicrobiales bacterium]|nr:hypothetical protein [Endomicrobiales bacterium]